jgi:DNA polymerase (family 10)
MDNRRIAATFETMADLLEFQGANPFRVRAYRNGARRIGDFQESLSAWVERGDDLTTIDGIGKDLAEKIKELVDKGRSPQLDELQSQVPASVLKLLRVPGLGPKKAAVLYNELGIDSLEKLREACEKQQLRQLKGFGVKTEQTLTAGIDIASAADKRMRWNQADSIVQSLLIHLKACKAIKRIEPAGSYRRCKETVGDIDLLVDADEAEVVMDHFAKYPDIGETLARGETKMSIRLVDGPQVDLRVVPTRSFGAALQYFTGSKEHNVTLRAIAKDRGMKVNEWGIFAVDGDREQYLAGKDEEDLYAALQLPCFPPELRENRNEFRWAEQGDLPRLVELSDLKGDLHMHTTASDGKNSIEEMVAAARECGLSYIVITDHSQRVSMAGGLDAQRLRQQWAEVDRINRQLEGFMVLKGIECDILEAGGMDLPDDVLEEADWVIASIHYGQNQSKQQITERILGALENRHVDQLAHPTGRLINKREPYQVDLDAVMDAAAKHGTFLELNANPLRLDLDDINVAQAKRRGIPIVINSDAHHAGGFDVLRYGVMQARRGGLTPTDVANCRSWSELKKLRQTRRA